MIENHFSKTNLEFFDCERLRPAPFYSQLFPTRFGIEKIIESVGQNGYRKEKPVVVRRVNKLKDDYEIVDGVCRWQAARTKGIKSIPAFVLDLSENDARAYAARENLQIAENGASLSIAQAIVLEREIRKATGEKKLMEKVLSATGSSKATYKRAAVSLNHAVEQLLKSDPFSGMTKRDPTAIIARAVKENVWQHFTDFYTGKMEVYTFFRTFYLGSEQSVAKSNKFGSKPVQTISETESKPKDAKSILSDLFANLRDFADFCTDGLTGSSAPAAECENLLSLLSQQSDSPERKTLSFLFKILESETCLNSENGNKRKKRHRKRQPGQTNLFGGEGVE